MRRFFSQRIVIFLKILFNPLRPFYYKISESILIRKAPSYHCVSLKRLNGKKKIKCVFLVLDVAGWKYDSVYRKMKSSPRFDPVILVCPRIGFGDEYMLLKMEEAEFHFKQELGYHTYKSYDKETGEYLDLIKVLNPDILFYCSPYRATIHPRYYITNFPQLLSVYVPYTFNNSIDYKAFHDELLHNLVWRYYAETEEHKMYSVLNARNRGRNVVVTGYPGLDPFLDKDYKPSLKDWKIQDSSYKRIIWAPHHTIADSGTVIFSCFLQYCDFMIDIAKKYANQVQFVLKPHPLLRPKLEKLWGKKKTDAYFDQWLKMPNASYTEGQYIDLFLTSDAMIHDSGSFIAEYLFLGKPVMRTMNDYPIDQMYNSFTQKCIENHYKAYSSEDIESFIQMVIDGVDVMKEKRIDFISREMIPSGMPSDNIINDIIYSIDNQILYHN